MRLSLLCFVSAGCQTAAGIPSSETDAGEPDAGDADSDADTDADTDTDPSTDTGPDPCAAADPAEIVSWSFETCDSGWTFGGAHPSWECGRPTSGPENDREIGGNLVATNVAGDYNDEEDSFALSPTTDTSAYTCLRLRFWHWYEFETVVGQSRDGGLVEASADGATFTAIAPVDGYDGAIDAGSSDRHVDGEDGFTNDGPIREWQEEVFDVSGFVGPSTTVRFYFGSDLAGPAPGWYVDDVVIEGA